VSSNTYFQDLIQWCEMLEGQYEKFTTIDEAAQYLHWIEMMEAGWTSANE